jgi:ATP-binding cassette, subfamily C (CFTR/MRP), member 1
MAQNRCVKDAEHGLDMENRAYIMTISMQRWLALRLDLFGNILVLGIALFAAGFRATVNPATIGVVLSYTLSSKVHVHNFYNCSAHPFYFISK